MERISNSQSNLETRLSETQERAERTSETKEQRTERITLDNMRIINGDANWINFLLDVGDGVANEYEDRVTLPEGLPVSEDLVDDVFGGLVPGQVGIGHQHQQSTGTIIWKSWTLPPERRLRSRTDIRCSFPHQIKE
uniref:Uncharacterized protein n=1 Tax=Caenorhabditis japonica TaxID=281687 RepID=A0A8R1IC72_CAEJA